MQQTTNETQSKRTGSHHAVREVIGWSSIEQPGFYVSRANGRGYRVPAEVLIAGASPAITVLGAENDRFVQISEDPYLPIRAAKLLCADNDVSPTF